MIKERKKTQPVVKELQPEPIIDYSSNPEYKQCIKCNEYRTRDYYYKLGTDSRFNTCKVCIKKKDDAEREQELIENGGSLKIPQKPNTYRDKYQKQLVFEFLPMLGWQFNEESGIWWKEGVKTQMGTFVNIKPNAKTFKKVSKEERIEIVRLRKTGMKLQNIADIMGVSKGAISSFLKKYYESTTS
jgi:hypothetical protein